MPSAAPNPTTRRGVELGVTFLSAGSVIALSEGRGKREAVFKVEPASHVSDQDASFSAQRPHLMARDSPGQAVRIATRVDPSHDLHRFEIHYGDVVVRRAGDIGAGAVGLDLDAGAAASDRNPFQLGVIRRANDLEIGGAEGRYEYLRSVGRELQAVGASHVGAEVCDGL